MDEVSEAVINSLLRGIDTESEEMKQMAVIEVEPAGDFITYGVGVSLMTMRHPDQVRGRAPVV